MGATSASWGHDSNNRLLQIAATGVPGYSYLFDANTGNLNYRTNLLRDKSG
jgi:hypothetical protein